jgi:starch synthase
MPPISGTISITMKTWQPTYETRRETNPVDFLASGVFAAHFVNTVSPHFPRGDRPGPAQISWKTPCRQQLTNKAHAECAAGILNAPDPFSPGPDDRTLSCTYGPDDHGIAKQKNKSDLQQMLGLEINA